MEASTTDSRDRSVSPVVLWTSTVDIIDWKLREAVGCKARGRDERWSSSQHSASCWVGLGRGGGRFPAQRYLHAGFCREGTCEMATMLRSAVLMLVLFAGAGALLLRGVTLLADPFPFPCGDGMKIARWRFTCRVAANSVSFSEDCHLLSR